MAQNAAFKTYNARAVRSIKREKLHAGGRKDLQAANRVHADKDWVEKDWIDCDVHFGLDANYLGYLYGIAKVGR